jgi:Bacterial Ig-like domain (group 3)/FG-GAP-like repeat
MVLTSARTWIAATVIFSSILGAAAAQSTVKPRIITKSTPATPFERTMSPLLGKLKLPTSRNTPSARMLSPDVSGVTVPNFGGYLSAPAYPARASNSIAYDSLNNGVQTAIAADFDKDGLIDVAVVQFDGTLNILRNTGGGVLAAPAGYINPNPNVGSENVAQSFAADLNGDGYPDIVAFDAANLVLLTFLNDGNGTFSTAQTITLSTDYGNPAGITVGDVNGDGKADVIVAYYNTLSRTSSQMSVQTLIGKGDGTFTAMTAATITVPTSLTLSGLAPVALGDLNGDGKLDIAALLQEQNSRSAGTIVVTTALGNGDGTFAALNVNSPISAAVSGIPNLSFNSAGVAILDLNKDGKQDLEVDMNGELYVALGNGDNSFSPQVSSDFQGQYAVAFADLNGDGYPDAICGSAGLQVYLGKGDGTFTAPAINGQYAIDIATPQGVVAADFNGDGKIDIAELGSDYKEVSMFFGDGDGTLHGALQLSLPTDVATPDTELENVLKATTKPYSDLVVLNLGGAAPSLQTGLSDGKGNFSYVPSLAAGLPADFNFVEPVQADFNGDGLQDLLMAGASGELWVSLSNGDGTFGTPVAINLPTLTCSLSYGTAGDLNGDGKQDIVVAYGGDSVCGGVTTVSGYFVIAGKGDGTFQTPVFFPSGAQLYSATLADMNLDGNLDLILDDVPTSTSGTFQVTLQAGNGDGTFGAESTLLTNYVVTDVKVADMNLDGNPDLLLAAEEVYGSDVTTAGLVLINGNGDGTFGNHSLIAGGNVFLQTQVADMNGDSIPDIEASLYTNGAQPNTYYGFSTLLGLGGGGFSAPFNQLIPLNGVLPLVGNFFDDNAPDVVTDTFYGIDLFLGQGGTTLTLGTSAASTVYGSVETFTAKVAASMAARPALTGTVSFFDGTTLLGTASVSTGSAIFSTSALALGTHTVSAVYSGDSNFNRNTSGTVSVAVTSLAPAFTLSSTSTALTLAEGANGAVPLTLTANATFSGPVNLTCTGAPSNASCGFSSNSVVLTAGSSATAALVIGTTGTKAAMAVPSSPWQNKAPMVSVASLVLMCFIRPRKKLRGVLFAALLAVAAMGAIGCSDGGPTVSSVGKTSFTVTVTATPAGSAGTAQTATVNVTVQ